MADQKSLGEKRREIERELRELARQAGSSLLERGERVRLSFTMERSRTRGSVRVTSAVRVSREQGPFIKSTRLSGENWREILSVRWGQENGRFLDALRNADRPLLADEFPFIPSHRVASCQRTVNSTLHRHELPYSVRRTHRDGETTGFQMCIVED